MYGVVRKGRGLVAPGSRHLNMHQPPSSVPLVPSTPAILYSSAFQFCVALHNSVYNFLYSELQYGIPYCRHTWKFSSNFSSDSFLLPRLCEPDIKTLSHPYPDLMLTTHPSTPITFSSPSRILNHTASLTAFSPVRSPHSHSTG